MDNKCGIYIIKSLIDNRVYIGQSNNVFQRLRHHKNALSGNYHVNRKMQFFHNKYGIDKLSFASLEFCGMELLNEREKYWVFYYNSHNEGFNCSNGGEDNPMNCPQNRKAISDALKGHKKTKEWMDKIIANRTPGLAFETRIKNGAIKYLYAYDAKTGILVHECYGFKDMAKRLQLNESNVRQIIDGKMNTAKGFHFSISVKSKEQVIQDSISKRHTEESRKLLSMQMMGKGNKMYGRKRPEISGEKNHMHQLIKNGFKFPNKLKITHDQIIELSKNGLTQKEIAFKAGCQVPNIGAILRKNGIRKFTRGIRTYRNKKAITTQ